MNHLLCHLLRRECDCFSSRPDKPGSEELFSVLLADLLFFSASLPLVFAVLLPALDRAALLIVLCHTMALDGMLVLPMLNP
jgi:hypothetical protein